MPDLGDVTRWRAQRLISIKTLTAPDVGILIFEAFAAEPSG